MANRQRDAVRERHWRQLIARWGRSGQTIRDFCWQQQISEPSFYLWRRTLAERDRRTAAASPRTRDRDSRQAASEPTFVPVRVLADSAAAADRIEVVLCNGRTLRVGWDFDPPALRQLLDLLEDEPC
jgi:transposase